MRKRPAGGTAVETALEIHNFFMKSEKRPAGGAAVDIVGILQTGHPLFQPHDLSCFIIICQLLQLGSNENLRGEIVKLLAR